MKTAVLALCLASAAAFAPARVARSTVAVSAGKSASVPFLPNPSGCDGKYAGDVGFDPIGLSNIDPLSLPQMIPPGASMAGEPLPTMYWMREAELKHGRIAMLAVVGFAAVDNGAYFPGLSASGLTAAAAHDYGVANGQMGFLLMLCSIFELCTVPALAQASKGSDREAGDFAFDPKVWTATPEGKKKQQLAEITHCRLAMLAFSGMVTQAVAVSGEFPYMG
mmetsp:Transcript_61496/g.139202  ORF Transcript_61496/g.139202 Transcript_61496/m.139202 type:complete len:222 (+) Transcript_61496:90-755(+)|eukprot:CAMPEP_0172644624 /NCGR_PEP_ID=MMETSP1068-20121228/239304_1 /TAXON_ID=35684 /ORGANISM="Pseudopedinella elastica, Strain CCMP716" /LENGTH=221 /DNA_ID=CAMNT_0013458829 /DNA_START=418 /DNA_END=1083 /DNA_ORIENTATION=-